MTLLCSSSFEEVEVKDYFREVVLPSVGLPYKGSYNLKEARKILGVCKVTLRTMEKRGDIYISPQKRIYAEEFSRYFNARNKTLD